MNGQSPFGQRSTKTTRSPTRSSERLKAKPEPNIQTPLGKNTEPKGTQPQPNTITKQEKNTARKATEQPRASEQIATTSETHNTNETNSTKTTQKASEQNTRTGNKYDITKPTENNKKQTNTIQTNTKTKTTMNQIQIQQTIASFVPEFSGEPSHNRQNELSRFIDTAMSIHETLTNDEERKIFIRLIKLRLTGDAYMRLSYRQLTSFKELCDILNNMYTETYSLDELERRLTTTQQTYGETIRNYGYRLLEALEKYKTAYTIKYNLNNIDVTYANHLDAVSVQAFKRGLSNTILKEKIATTRANNLNDIIKETEVIDKMLTDSTWTTTPVKTTTIPTPTITATPQRTNNHPAVSCNYCQRPNHTWDICRTRLSHEQLKKSIQGQQYSNSPPRHQYSKSPNTNYNTNRQRPNIRTDQPAQPYYNPRQTTNQYQQRPQIQFEPARQQIPYQQYQPRNNFTPKYCSHCKTTTGHTYNECRSKFFSRQINSQPNQNNQSAPPDPNTLTDSFNKMHINMVYPPQHRNECSTTQHPQPENSNGSDQP